MNKELGAVKKVLINSKGRKRVKREKNIKQDIPKQNKPIPWKLIPIDRPPAPYTEYLDKLIELTPEEKIKFDIEQEKHIARPDQYPAPIDPRDADPRRFYLYERYYPPSNPPPFDLGPLVPDIDGPCAAHGSLCTPVVRKRPTVNLTETPETSKKTLPTKPKTKTKLARTTRRDRRSPANKNLSSSDSSIEVAKLLDDPKWKGKGKGKGKRKRPSTPTIPEPVSPSVKQQNVNKWLDDQFNTWLCNEVDAIYLSDQCGLDK